MRRIHLFELEDFDWVPRAVRDGATDLLDLGFTKIGFYDGVAPRLLALLEATGARRVVDVCSGGGGGTLHMRRLVRAAGSEVELVLTDRNPSEAGMARVRALGDARTSYLERPVDAMAGPGAVDGAALDGVRTMSGALHHFRPDEVRALISSIVAQGAPLAFFDVAASPALRRAPVVLAPPAMAMNMIVLFVGALFLVPLVRPFRLTRVLLTYLLPLIPLLFAWDGTVSALRAYTADEVLAIARSVPGGDRYVWEAGVAGSALFLTGMPARAA
ncbi:hypothetical protein SOCEGT47_080060 [Sorangium cellulosum]|uniref:Methyltransferase domain-containing protein n=1 Tax=Sorangium cellulosum TaxID=56 RepID=A0A4P2QCE9_SORCE|nr:hypothetical protein [Sorangium cellulosum]AUX27417.1 hypothetical protein SOCEGT47_080060 [Sorangium cellulosum]